MISLVWCCIWGWVTQIQSKGEECVANEKKVLIILFFVIFPSMQRIVQSGPAKY